MLYKLTKLEIIDDFFQFKEFDAYPQVMLPQGISVIHTQ